MITRFEYTPDFDSQSLVIMTYDHYLPLILMVNTGGYSVTFSVNRGTLGLDLRRHGLWISLFLYLEPG